MTSVLLAAPMQTKPARPPADHGGETQKQKPGRVVEGHADDTQYTSYARGPLDAVPPGKK
eukprot:11998784-Ditylum_brightwellii.AAC.1